MIDHEIDHMPPLQDSSERLPETEVTPELALELRDTTRVIGVLSNEMRAAILGSMVLLPADQVGIGPSNMWRRMQAHMSPGCPDSAELEVNVVGSQIRSGLAKNGMIEPSAHRHESRQFSAYVPTDLGNYTGLMAGRTLDFALRTGTSLTELLGNYRAPREEDVEFMSHQLTRLALLAEIRQRDGAQTPGQELGAGLIEAGYIDKTQVARLLKGMSRSGLILTEKQDKPLRNGTGKGGGAAAAEIVAGADETQLAHIDAALELVRDIHHPSADVLEDSQARLHAILSSAPDVRRVLHISTSATSEGRRRNEDDTLAILQASLQDGPRPTHDVARALGMSDEYTLLRLHGLAEAGLVERFNDGQRGYHWRLGQEVTVR